MSTQQGSGRINTDGLFFYIDANNERSYNGVGTTLRDLSKSEMTAELLNGVSWNSSFFSFDGSNDEIVIKNQDLKTLQVPMTFMCWFVDTVSSGLGVNWVQSIFSQYSGYTLGNFVKRVYIVSRKVGYQSSSIVSPFVQNFQTTATFSANTWNFLSVTVDGTMSSSTVTLGLNGIYQTFSATQFSSPNSIDIRIANGLEAGGERWNGKLSSIIIYNRALSQDEINYTYTLTKNKFGQ